MTGTISNSHTISINKIARGCDSCKWRPQVNGSSSALMLTIFKLPRQFHKKMGLVGTPESGGASSSLALMLTTFQLPCHFHKKLGLIEAPESDATAQFATWHEHAKL